ARVRGDGAAAGFLGAVAALWKYALDSDWEVQPGVCARLRRALQKGEYPAWEEADLQLALSSGLPERLRRALVLAAGTGQRRSDLVAMQWSDYSGDRIRLTQVKTGVKLSLPCPPELRDELEACERD